MAQEVTHIHQVRGGQVSEYFSSFQPAATGDILLMSFEGIITFDNVVVSTSTGSEYDISLDLLYPSSEKTLNLITGKSINGVAVWSMNARYSTFGTTDTGKLWFNVPSGSSLKCTISNWVSGGQLTLLVVGT